MQFYEELTRGSPCKLLKPPGLDPINSEEQRIYSEALSDCQTPYSITQAQQRCRGTANLPPVQYLLLQMWGTGAMLVEWQVFNAQVYNRQ